MNGDKTKNPTVKWTMVRKMGNLHTTTKSITFKDVWRLAHCQKRPMDLNNRALESTQAITRVKWSHMGHAETNWSERSLT